MNRDIPHSTNIWLRGLALALCFLGAILLPHLSHAQTTTAAQVDVVFVMDTSGSMDDEFAVLCNEIPAVVRNLENRSVKVNYTVLGITETRDCATRSVAAETPGLTVDHQEDWGPAIRDISGAWAWKPGYIRLIVPMSDEGPQDGNPCEDPGPDRDVVNQAILAAQSNHVRVAPILGTIEDPAHAACTHEMFKALVHGFGTLYTETKGTSEDLADFLFLIIGGVADDQDGDGIPDADDPYPFDACKPDAQLVCYPRQVCGISNTPHWDDDYDREPDEESENGRDDDGDGMIDEDVGGPNCPFPPQSCGVNSHRGFDDDADAQIDEETENKTDDDGDGYIDEDVACACPPGQTQTTATKGVDDDHDYRVDEEIPNGRDDDGDGCIDEDVGDAQMAEIKGRTVEHPGDGRVLVVPAVALVGSQRVQVSADGVFSLPVAAPGDYEVIVEAAGFAPALRYELKVEQGEVVDLGELNFVRTSYLDQLEAKINQMEARYPLSQAAARDYLRDLRSNRPILGFEEEAVRRLLLYSRFVSAQEGDASEQAQRVYRVFFEQGKIMIDTLTGWGIGAFLREFAILPELSPVVRENLPLMQGYYAQEMAIQVAELVGDQTVGEQMVDLYTKFFAGQIKGDPLELAGPAYNTTIDVRLQAAVALSRNGAFHPGTFATAETKMDELAWDRTHTTNVWRELDSAEEVFRSWRDTLYAEASLVAALVTLPSPILNQGAGLVMLAATGMNGIDDVSAADRKTDQILGRLYRQLPSFAGRGLRVAYDTQMPISRTTRTRLRIRLRSPAYLQVIDPLGRRIGATAADGIALEVPGSAYIGPKTEPQHVMIGNVLPGRYTIQLVGSGYGKVTVDVEATLDDEASNATPDVSVQTLEAQIVPGARLVSFVSISEDSNGTLLVLPPSALQLSPEQQIAPTPGDKTLLYLVPLLGLIVAVVAGGWLVGHGRSARPKANLSISAGPGIGRRFVLTGSPTSIGREQGNSVTLDDDLVSRRHAVIRRAGATYTIEDLDSTTGTFVNHQRISRAVLHDGDEIGIGETLLTFRTKL